MASRPLPQVIQSMCVLLWSSLNFRRQLDITLSWNRNGRMPGRQSVHVGRLCALSTLHSPQDSAQQPLNCALNNEALRHTLNY
jgi:hypothetical protein